MLENIGVTDEEIREAAASLTPVERQFAATQAAITPGYALPEVDDLRSRKMGLCLHHSYIPELPKNINHAEAFNRFHFGEIEDWKLIDGKWENPEGSWWGLRYDFVVAFRKDVVSEFWTSMRWIRQLGGGHSRNVKKHLRWKDGTLVQPNTQLVSVCVVGNYDKYSVPAEALAMVRGIAKSTDVLPNLFFHSDFDFKTCPGSKVNRADVRAAIFGGKEE
jgi:hypothetical protein